LNPFEAVFERIGGGRERTAGGRERIGGGRILQTPAAL
jgi:hypothetical protein